LKRKYRKGREIERKPREKEFSIYPQNGRIKKDKVKKEKHTHTERERERERE
jgi:hypothetical protein